MNANETSKVTIERMWLTMYSPVETVISMVLTEDQRVLFNVRRTKVLPESFWTRSFGHQNPRRVRTDAVREVREAECFRQMPNANPDQQRNQPCAAVPSDT